MDEAVPSDRKRVTMFAKAFAPVCALLFLAGLAVGDFVWNHDEPRIVSRNTDRDRPKPPFAEEGERLADRVALYALDKGKLPELPVTVFQAMVSGGYVGSVSPGWTILRGLPVRPLTADQCFATNLAMGRNMSEPAVSSFDGCPPCEDPRFADYPACDYAGSVPAVTESLIARPPEPEHQYQGRPRFQ